MNSAYKKKRSQSGDWEREIFNSNLFDTSVKSGILDKIISGIHSLLGSPINALGDNGNIKKRSQSGDWERK